MARQEHSREDLLRDAVALVPRIQFRLAEHAADPVVCGFRGDALSVYFGEDPAYHFNGAGELRRAFADGKLLKALDGKLVEMERRRTPDSTELASQPLPGPALAAFLTEAKRRLTDFADRLAAGAYAVDGCVPAETDPIPRILSLLPALAQIRIAQAPNVGA